MTKSVLSVKSHMLHKKLVDFYGLSEELISNELVHSKSFEDKLFHVFQRNPLRSVQIISHVTLALLLFMQLHPQRFLVRIRPQLLQWILFALMFGNVVDIICNLQPYKSEESETLIAGIEKVQLSLLSLARCQQSIGIMFALIFTIAFSRLYRKSYQFIPIPFLSGIRLLSLSQILPSSIVLLAITSRELFIQYIPFIDSWWLSDNEENKRKEFNFDEKSEQLEANVSVGSESNLPSFSSQQKIGDSNSVVFRLLSDIQQYGDLLLVIASLSMWKVLIRRTEEKMSSILFTTFCSLILMQISYLTVQELSREPSSLFYSIRQMLFSKNNLDLRFRTDSLPIFLEDVKNQGSQFFKQMRSFASWLGRSTQSLSISSSLVEIDLSGEEENASTLRQENLGTKKSANKRVKGQRHKRLSHKLKNRRRRRTNPREKVSLMEEKEQHRNIASIDEEALHIASDVSDLSNSLMDSYSDDKIGPSNSSELSINSIKHEIFSYTMEEEGTAELKANEEEQQDMLVGDSKGEDETSIHVEIFQNQQFHNNNTNQAYSILEENTLPDGPDTPILMENSSEQEEEPEDYYEYESQIEIIHSDQSNPVTSEIIVSDKIISDDSVAYDGLKTPVSIINSITEDPQMPRVQSESEPISQHESHLENAEQIVNEDVEEDNWEGDEDNCEGHVFSNGEYKAVIDEVHSRDIPSDNSCWDQSNDTSSSDLEEWRRNNSPTADDDLHSGENRTKSVEIAVSVVDDTSTTRALIEPENDNVRSEDPITPSEHLETARGENSDESDIYEYEYEYSDEDLPDESNGTNNTAENSTVNQEDVERLGHEENHLPQKNKEEENPPTSLLNEDDSGCSYDPDEIILDLDAPTQECKDLNPQECPSRSENHEVLFPAGRHDIPSLFEDNSDEDLEPKHP